MNRPRMHEDYIWMTIALIVALILMADYTRTCREGCWRVPDEVPGFTAAVAVSSGMPPARRQHPSSANLPELTRDEYTQLVALARRVKAGIAVRIVVEKSRRRGTLHLVESIAYETE